MAAGLRAGQLGAIALFLVALSVVALSRASAEKSELYGVADKWEADEDRMTLGVADQLAKESLIRSRRALRGKYQGEEGDYGSDTEGLGDRISSLQQKDQSLKLQEKDLHADAKLLRSKAHMLRLQASGDISQAHKELDRVIQYDKTLKGIKQSAKGKRVAFATGTKAVMAASKQISKVQHDAARVTRKIKGLRGKVQKLMQQLSREKGKRADYKNEIDMEREDLSSALVRRNRRERRVKEMQASLAKTAHKAKKDAQ